MSKTIVVKLGTSVLTGGTKKLNKARMLEIVRQCATLTRQGHRIVLVTSGAIAAGREFLDYPELPAGIAYKQLLASVGQSKLIQYWEQLFSIYSLFVGQMLLTRADLEDRERFLNASDMLRALLEYGIIPVINENDAIAVAEIKVGDNDQLSALVAALARADELILLSDIDGLYTANPNTDPSARLIPHVENITGEIRAMAGDAISGLGTGGMSTKIQAATYACSVGIDVVIASGDTDDVLLRIIGGEEIGTRFHASERSLMGRKKWIFGAPVVGTLVVDKGAEKALCTNGGSLLPIGIVSVQGHFSRGEVVSVQTLEGVDLAHGVARYNSEDLSLIMRHRSQDIQSILGYEHGSVAIHRDDLFLLGS